MEARRVQARQWRDQQIRDLGTLPQRTSQQEEQLRALRLEREFERRAQEAEQDDEDGEGDKVGLLTISSSLIFLSIGKLCCQCIFL